MMIALRIRLSFGWISTFCLVFICSTLSYAEPKKARFGRATMAKALESLEDPVIEEDQAQLLRFGSLQQSLDGELVINKKNSRFLKQQNRRPKQEIPQWWPFGAAMLGYGVLGAIVMLHHYCQQDDSKV